MFTQAQIDALATTIATAAATAVVEALAAQVTPDAPAKVTRPKAAAKRKPARKAAPKAQPKADVKLCKATRARFVAAAAKEGVDFASCSTKAIAAMCLEDEALIPAGFAIGEGYRTLLG
jgi:hypothetical protein